MVRQVVGMFVQFGCAEPVLHNFKHLMWLVIEGITPVETLGELKMELVRDGTRVGGAMFHTVVEAQPAEGKSSSHLERLWYLLCTTLPGQATTWKVLSYDCGISTPSRS